MGDVKDADYDKDMKLPFKMHDNYASPFINVYLPSEKVTILKQVPFLEKKNFEIKDEILLSSFLSNIWQPPRIC